MPEWKEYVRERLRLPSLRPERAAELADDVAAQLEAAYELARSQGATEAEAMARAESEIPDWGPFSREVEEAEQRHTPPMEQRGLNHLQDSATFRKGRISMLRDFLADFLYAVRVLRKSPGFAITAILTLALGIGANTAIFSLVNTLLLRPLPIEAPERFVRVYTGVSHTSYPDYEEFQRLDGVFSGLLAHRIEALNLGEGETIQRALGDLVTGNYFELLGVRAQLGRTFSPQVDLPRGVHAVAVISDGMWKRRFAADPGVMGRTLVLNGQRFEIIGVAPEGFHGTFNFGLAPEVWVPLSMQPVLTTGTNHFADRRQIWLEVFGRLNPGVTVEQADGAARALGQRLAKEYPQQSPRIEHTEVYAMTGANAFRGMSKKDAIFAFVGVLMAMAGLVLLIACANLANLQLARGAARRKEMAVRQALGASRGRMVRQLLTESLLLALVAGSVACLVGFWATGVLRAWEPPVPVPMEIDLRMDGRVLGFSLVASLLTGVLFGLFPALGATRVDVVTQLKEGAAQAAHGRKFNVRDALVVAQVGVCLVLLVCAGLFLRSTIASQRMDPGFDADRVLTVELNLEASGYDAARGRLLVRSLAERIEGLPGVEAVSFARMVPLTGSSMGLSLEIEGYERLDGENPNVSANVVGARYFEVMGIPVLAGREFTSRDTPEAPHVAMVNETMARRYWPGKDPVGKRLRVLGFGPEEQPWMEVVGVVRNSKYRSPGENPTSVLYLAGEQDFDVKTTLHVRTAGEPSAWAGAVRRAILAQDRTLLAQTVTLREQTALGVLPSRIAATLLGAFGALGMGLALVGIYGVVAFVVTQRTREIGVRMALGAQPRNVMALVLGRALRLALVGITGGALVAAGLTRVIASLLTGVSPSDPATYAGVAALLVVAVLLAGYLPARRAARVDPMIALRYE